jgi:hypothetical protein
VAVDSVLDAFVALLKNGQAGQVVGVYVPDVLALRVAQQPADNLAYVKATLGYATQFKLAAQNGAIGLLAHNDLSGALFSGLSVGQTVHIIYGDGSIHRYSISALRHFHSSGGHRCFSGPRRPRALRNTLLSSHSISRRLQSG